MYFSGFKSMSGKEVALVPISFLLSPFFKLLWIIIWQNIYMFTSESVPLVWGVSWTNQAINAISEYVNVCEIQLFQNKLVQPKSCFGEIPHKWQHEYPAGWRLVRVVVLWDHMILLQQMNIRCGQTMLSRLMKWVQFKPLKACQGLDVNTQILTLGGARTHD